MYIQIYFRIILFHFKCIIAVNNSINVVEFGMEGHPVCQIIVIMIIVVLIVLNQNNSFE